MIPMKKKMTIRKGNEDDLEAFFNLYWISSEEHTHYSGALDILKPKQQCKEFIISRQRQFLMDPQQFFFVAEANNKIIGMITGHVGLRDESMIYSIERIGFVDEICIDPAYRNTGIGGRLLNTMLDELYKQNVRFVGVGVAFKNPAFHFYKRHRFTPEGMWLIQDKKSYKKTQQKKQPV
jgi:GNAT superfamily N-acetyltransferase